MLPKRNTANFSVFSVTWQENRPKAYYGVGFSGIDAENHDQSENAAATFRNDLKAKQVKNVTLGIMENG